MNNYKIGRDGYAYMPYSKTIELCTRNDALGLLDDNEFLTSIADSITHEFIHYLLHKEFNLTVCKLFDTIGHFFYTNYELLERVTDKYSHCETWKHYIKNHGMNNFLQHYRVTNRDFFEAVVLCQGI